MSTPVDIDQGVRRRGFRAKYHKINDIYKSVRNFKYLTPLIGDMKSNIRKVSVGSN